MPNNPGTTKLEAENRMLAEQNEALRRELEELKQRQGVSVHRPPDEGEAVREADKLLQGLRTRPLGKDIGLAAVLHVVLLLLTSFGFTVRCIQQGTLHPDRDGPAVTGEQTTAGPDGTAQSAASNAVAAAGTATNEPDAATEEPAGTSRIEQELSETSEERPTESEMRLFEEDLSEGL